MRLKLEGNINQYYVQTLCMIFFPGTKFGQATVSRDDPLLQLKLKESPEGVTATASMSYGGNTAKQTFFRAFTENEPADLTRKKVTGEAVVTVGGDLLSYRPSWGMLTGVRPSKVATELLNEGFSKTRVRKMLNTEYMVIPKKAALATDVALAEKKIIGIPDRRDCSVYISIPFCPTRCAYCSFVSYTSRKLLGLIPEYLERLLEDIGKTFGLIKELGLNVRSIYIGGGTPTILDGEQLKRLLAAISGAWDLGRVEEFTLEAGRPDTITYEKMKTAVEMGVTRCSVNPQTLSDDVLREIGRAHTAGDFMRAYEETRKAGVHCINTDMIAGLPGDNFGIFSSSYDKILSLQPENVTVHTFCVKKAADLRAGADVYSMRGGDAGKCVDYTQIKSVQMGYKPYYMYRQKNTVGNFENVGFAKDGYESLYNIFMMEEIHSIFAVGAGAVAKMVDWTPEKGGKPVINRLFYDKYPYEYLAKNKTDELLGQARKFYEERFTDL